MSEEVPSTVTPPRFELMDNARRPPSADSADYHRSRSPSARDVGPRDPEPALHHSQYLCSVHHKGRSKNHVERTDDDKWRCKRGHECVIGRSGTMAVRDPSLGRPFRTSEISKAMSYALRYPKENLPSMHRVPPLGHNGEGGIILRNFQDCWANLRNIPEGQVKDALGKHLFKSPSPRRGHQALRFAVGLDPSTGRVMIRSPATPRDRR